jgi:hypothetical protein
MEKSTVRLIQKYRRDLLRFNDPTVGWGESEHYHQYLAWGRAMLMFGASLTIVGLVAWGYMQLRADPYQQFLQTCRQQGVKDSTCSTQWERKVP